MELACLGTDQRTRTVHPSIGPGEQVLKALHGSMHVLEQEAAGIIFSLKGFVLIKTGACNTKFKKTV